MVEKRKTQFVHRDIQLSLVKSILFQWLVFVIATCVITVTVQYLVDPLQSQAIMAQRIKLTVGTMLLVSLCLAPLFVRDSIRLSHRVVGPLVRLRRCMQNVDVHGKNDRISLREKDFLKEVITDYNSLLDRVEAAQAERQPVSDEVSSEFDDTVKVGSTAEEASEPVEA